MHRSAPPPLSPLPPKNSTTEAEDPGRLKEFEVYVVKRETSIAKIAAIEEAFQRFKVEFLDVDSLKSRELL